MNRQASAPAIYAAALVLAACSLLYELLIAQTLATLAANTVVWFSLTIGVYLASMGLGALLHDRYPTPSPWVRLFRVEIMLSVVGAVAVPILNMAHTVSLLFDLESMELVSHVVFFGAALVLTVAIGLLTGFELPLLIDLANAASGEKRVTNRVLASDYGGSLLGGLAFPLLLLPSLSLFVIGLLTAGVNLAVAMVAMRWLPVQGKPPLLRLTACGTVSAAILLALVFSPPIERYFVKNYYFYFDHSDDLKTLFGSMRNASDVFRERSPYQRIDIVHDRVGYDTDILIDAYSTKFRDNPEQPRNYVLFLNGDYQLASSYEEYYHEFFAHIPIMTNGAVPRRVLVMGAGDGLLIRELIKYPDVESIVHVDLDQKLVELAETHPVLLAMNEGALGDPRVRTYFDDAYRYIRRTSDLYDAIFLDFPYVKDYNLSKLYSREFLHFVRQRVAPGGFVVLDVPGFEKRAKLREIYTSTVAAAGYQYVKPYVSTIETDNRRALAILRRSGYRYSAAERLLREHAKSLRYTFIIARDDLPEAELFRDPRVKLHVLTNQRLRLTLQKELPPVEATSPAQVNSILRPTLPTDRFKGIRKAW